MRSRAINSWYRKAIVLGSILCLALIGGGVFFLLDQNKSSASAARLLADASATAGVSGSTDAATGGLRLCNKTASRIGIAIGYKEKQEWVTEGWWNVASSTCETLMAGPLVSRFYYVYAIDYDQGGTWSGKAQMCTRDKMFTIRGIEDCVARGYDRNGFFEVDTGEQRSWTVQLTEPGETGTGGK
jgi:uncharacterized membrane protein